MNALSFGDGRLRLSGLSTVPPSCSWLTRLPGLLVVLTEGATAEIEGETAAGDVSVEVGAAVGITRGVGGGGGSGVVMRVMGGSPEGPARGGSLSMSWRKGGLTPRGVVADELVGWRYGRFSPEPAALENVLVAVPALSEAAPGEGRLE